MISLPSIKKVVASSTLSLLVTFAHAEPVKTSNPPKEPLPLNEIRTFAEIFELIKQSYVQPIDDKTLMDNAIKGMLSNLDPHSAYLDSNTYKALEELSSGQFGGIGIEIEKSNNLIKIITPIDNSPASRAGIKPGDIIIKIDNTLIQDMALEDVSKKIAGKIGETVQLTLIRDNGKPFIVNLIRENIKIKSVTSRLLEKNYGYIRISQFQINTGDEVKQALQQLTHNNTQPLKGIVLDLRNNPGGILHAAVSTVDQFVTKGLIVYTKGRTSESEARFYAHPDDPSNNVPLIVLINSGTASAAEIVAGALQDLKRAIIMGTKSFGKGSVQAVLPINKTHALKLTTALYYTPNGRSIQAEGIVPDIKVEQITTAQENKKEPTLQITEANLEHHLNNKNNKSSEHPYKKAASLENTDYQLSQAISLLKGLNIIKHK